MENNKLNKSVMEFVKATIKNPEILEDSEGAKKIAKTILHKNMAEKELEEKRA